MIVRFLYNKRTQRLEVYVDGVLVRETSVAEEKITHSIGKLIEELAVYSPTGLVPQLEVCNG